MASRAERRLSLLRTAFGRRDFLRGLAVGAAGATLPTALLVDGCGKPAAQGALPAAAAGPTFLTGEEAAALGRLADWIFPADGASPGGSALGVVPYVQGYLTAFERSVPFVYAGGPFSGRQPLPGPDGSPSKLSPSDDFSSFVPLDRVRELNWRLTLYGSNAVPGGGPTDALSGPTIGLRDQIRATLQAALAAAKGPLDALPDSQVETIFDGLGSDQQALLVELVLEGVLSAPEYGGNVNGAGWALAHFPGDSAPLGYSLFDPATQSYSDRPGFPVTTADPGPDPDPMDAQTEAIIEQLVGLTGGRKYY